jgi:hypothetical protein
MLAPKAIEESLQVGRERHFETHRLVSDRVLEAQFGRVQGQTRGTA